MQRERPIIFSSEMIRAILEGRKTQTRREIKGAELEVNHPAVHSWALSPNDNKWYAKAKNDETKQQYITTFPFHGIKCPYGKIGDKLWLKEVWWASRITLEITNIRVERLNDINANDAEAEGAFFWHQETHKAKHGYFPPGITDGTAMIGAFKRIWESIKGTDSWQKNPWVWVIEFKVITN